MSTATLDDFMALNDQLAALVEAGVPLELGLEATGEDAGTTLEKINAAVARRVSRGASLDEALDDDGERLPPAYRCLVQVGLRSGRLDAALDGSQRVAETVEQTRNGVRSAFVYPLIVCGLVLLGLAGFRIYLVPILSDVYASMRVAPGRALRLLATLPGELNVWLMIGGAALATLIAWWLLKRSRFAPGGSASNGLWRHTPGASQAIAQERWASFASSLGALVAAETPLPEALRLAACASGDAAVGNAARGLANSLDNQTAPTTDNPAGAAFPPFLRWALLESEPAVGRARALAMAADLYRDSASRNIERVRVVTPMMACILLGGGAVLLYGLALFVPITELLAGIAVQPPAS
jgi:type II secretory pathway component PulF